MSTPQRTTQHPVCDRSTSLSSSSSSSSSFCSFSSSLSSFSPPTSSSSSFFLSCSSSFSSSPACSFSSLKSNLSMLKEFPIVSSSSSSSSSLLSYSLSSSLPSSESLLSSVLQSSCPSLSSGCPSSSASSPNSSSLSLFFNFSSATIPQLSSSPSSYVFHERQSLLQCARHTTNNILQSPFYSRKDFEQLADNLASSFFLQPESSNTSNDFFSSSPSESSLPFIPPSSSSFSFASSTSSFSASSLSSSASFSSASSSSSASAFSALNFFNFFSSSSSSISCSSVPRRRPFFSPNPHKNFWGLGDYDINIIELALRPFQLKLQWFDIRKSIRTELDISSPNCIAIIVSSPLPSLFDPSSSSSLSRWDVGWLSPFASRHFFALRKIEQFWYNLDSRLSQSYTFEDENDVKKFLCRVCGEDCHDFLQEEGEGGRKTCVNSEGGGGGSGGGGGGSGGGGTRSSSLDNSRGVEDWEGRRLRRDKGISGIKAPAKKSDKPIFLLRVLKVEGEVKEEYKHS